jgi:hypothetical protein
MAHPENAYAFNEMSLSCCPDRAGCEVLSALLDAARAWRLHESGPLVGHLKRTDGFDELQRSARYRDKVIVLLDSAVNRPGLFESTTTRLLWQGVVARGMTVADFLNGFVLSWPCGCETWREYSLDVVRQPGGQPTTCRHVGSEDHLRAHWKDSAKAAKDRSRRPSSVQRIDDAMNEARGEVPQVHFRDGSALNIDGVWKHGSRTLNGEERAWLVRVGWVLPV